ncbi:MAG: hypothetical protein ACLR23_04840 [Clostridia bacterium]
MFWVQTGKGVIAVEELQLQGKKMMPASAFLLGNKVEEKSYRESDAGCFISTLII